MTEAFVVRTDVPGAGAAGRSIGLEIAGRLGGRRPDAVIVFASPAHSHASLLSALEESCHPRAVAGCSTAGELTDAGLSDASVVALAIVSDSMQFRTAIGRGLRADLGQAVDQLATELSTVASTSFPHRTVLLFSDALAGSAEAMLRLFTKETHGRYQVAGGGAADDARFSRTPVFFGRELIEDAVVALEIQSQEPVGIGVAHGWTPGSLPMQVTRTRGRSLVTLNDIPAFDMITSVAKERGQTIDRASPLPYFLHNVIGMETTQGYKLRVPLSVEDDGALACAAEVAEGSTIRLMCSSDASTQEAAAVAAGRAMRKMKGAPAAVLFFDCAATRLRMGRDFGLSVTEITRQFPNTPCVGFNTYGQFARVNDQFSGFHNCTAVVCAIPR